MTRTIGIDVGGTNLRMGVFDGVQLIKEKRIQADFSIICKNNPPDKAWQEILTVTAEGVASLLGEYPQIEKIGIGFPGFLAPDTKMIMQSPNLPGLQQVNLATDLAHRLNKTVVVENDANAAAYGEYCLAGKPATGLIYLGLGTGVGGGLILNGQPYLGHHGCAMEVGHITVVPEGRLCGCGNLGCMEQYASASGVSLTYQEATQQQLTAADIATLARTADADAIKAYQVAADALAQALASVLKVVDVKHVVIGGGMAAAWNLMEKAFHQRLNQDLIPALRNQMTINMSRAEDIAGMLGAAMLAAHMDV